MLYISPTIHKLEIGDIIQSLKETDLSIFGNEPVIYLGESSEISAYDGKHAFKYKPSIVYYLDTCQITTSGLSYEQLQKMINDEEIAIWTK